jgi:hypothetical protein
VLVPLRDLRHGIWAEDIRRDEIKYAQPCCCPDGSTGHHPFIITDDMRIVRLQRVLRALMVRCLLRPRRLAHGWNNAVLAVTCDWDISRILLGARDFGVVLVLVETHTGVVIVGFNTASCSMGGRGNGIDHIAGLFRFGHDGLGFLFGSVSGRGYKVRSLREVERSEMY